jgi:hypothetical protein
MGHVRATQALLGWASELSGEALARQALAQRLEAGTRSYLLP